MKKTLLCVFAVSMMAFGTSAKAQSFEEGMNVVSVGIGFPNIYKSIYDIYEFNSGYTSSGFGPINFKYEHALTDQIGLGASVSFLTYKNAWETGSGFEEVYKGSLFALLVRGNYHFATGDKLDPYVGIGIGYMGLNFEYYNDDPDYVDDGFSFDFGSPFGYSGSIGARYYFTDMLGAYAEIGWDGLALMQIGLSASF